jgi:hypothetical protein
LVDPTLPVNRTVCLQSVECEENIYPPYPVAPEEDWPVIFYHVTFYRAWQPYARGFFVMQIMLYLIAFLCFWIPPQCGERMGLTISAIVAAVASELVISSALPAASEITWFAKFSLTSMTFASVCLFDSAAVIYFHDHTGDDLIPDWVKGFMRRGKTVSPQELIISANTAAETQDPRTLDAIDEDKDGNSRKYSSPVEKLEQSEKTEKPTTFPSISERDESDYLSRDLVKKESTPSVEFGNDAPSRPTLDSESSKSIRWEGDEASVAEDANSTEPPPRPILRRSTQPPPEYTQSISRSMRTHIKTILGRDADDYKNGREMVNNHRWQRVGNSIDQFSRVFFPVAYAIFLAVAF